MWTKKRVLAAVGLTVGGLGSVFAGAAWAPPAGDLSGVSFSHVRLSVDGVEVATFSRCLGLGSKHEVVAHQSGTESGTSGVSLIPGRYTAGTTVCERGMSSDLTLSAWRDLVSTDTAAARKNGTFTLYDSAGAPVVRWNTTRMWPSELTHHFDAARGREVITFVSESTTRVAP